MPYTILFSPQAEDDLLALRATERARVLDAIEIHLSFEPEKESKSRIKQLQGHRWPQYRLRIDDLRAFYDVLHEAENDMVEILAIREKTAAMQWLMEYGISDT